MKRKAEPVTRADMLLWVRAASAAFEAAIVFYCRSEPTPRYHEVHWAIIRAIKGKERRRP